ncbi:MAG: hypothetical protein QM761_03845 [Pseudoxanthomonas sp.]
MIRPLFLAAALSVAAVMANAQETPQEKPDPADLAQSKEIACSALMFRVLPGDFNFCLGQKYWEKGNYKAAMELMQLAAGWGNKAAQGVLGIAYFNGDGAPRDRALGLAWLALAAERQEPQRAGMYLGALADADEAEKAQAARLYRQMRGEYADEVAAARADKRYLREIRALANNPVYGSGRCIDGTGTGPIEEAAVLNPGADTRGRGPAGAGCSLAQEQAVIRGLQAYSDVYFEGWKGHVTVEPIEIIKGAK